MFFLILNPRKTISQKEIQIKGEGQKKKNKNIVRIINFSFLLFCHLLWSIRKKIIHSLKFNVYNFLYKFGNTCSFFPSDMKQTKKKEETLSFFLHTFSTFFFHLKIYKKKEKSIIYSLIPCCSL